MDEPETLSPPLQAAWFNIALQRSWGTSAPDASWGYFRQVLLGGVAKSVSGKVNSQFSRKADFPVPDRKNFLCSRIWSSFAKEMKNFGYPDPSVSAQLTQQFY